MKETSLKSFKDPRTQEKISSETKRIQKVFEAFPEYEMTAHNIASKCIINYFVIQKRLSILIRKDVIEQCGTERVNGRDRTLYRLKKK